MQKTIMSFELSDELREKLRVEAFSQRLTHSATIRRILEEYFENKEKQENKNQGENQ